MAINFVFLLFVSIWCTWMCTYCGNAGSLNFTGYLSAVGVQSSPNQSFVYVYCSFVIRHRMLVFLSPLHPNFPHWSYKRCRTTRRCWEGRKSWHNFAKIVSFMSTLRMPTLFYVSLRPFIISFSIGCDQVLVARGD